VSLYRGFLGAWAQANPTRSFRAPRTRSKSPRPPSSSEPRISSAVAELPETPTGRAYFPYRLSPQNGAATPSSARTCFVVKSPGSTAPAPRPADRVLGPGPQVPRVSGGARVLMWGGHLPRGYRTSGAARCHGSRIAAAVRGPRAHAVPEAAAPRPGKQTPAYALPVESEAPGARPRRDPRRRPTITSMR